MEPVPSIGIVIPTYNRQDRLLECLRHLERQTWTDFEVVIVDDGSTDGTAEAIERYRPTAPFPLRLLRQANLGAATGRNRAIALVQAPVCILIGDDIFPCPEFVRIHLEFHREHAESEAVALGFTRWSRHGQVVTPFMEWAGMEGVQFAYGDLIRGEPADWRHFYTSNLSFKTAYLRENPFHEGFHRYGMEDIELGYRLAMRHGLHMFFLPNAIADHLHPTTFRGTCRRMLHVGEGVVLFHRLWPERDPPRAKGPVERILVRVLTEPHVMLPLLAWIGDLSVRVRCPNLVMKFVLKVHQLAGLNLAMSKPSPSPAA